MEGGTPASGVGKKRRCSGVGRRGEAEVADDIGEERNGGACGLSSRVGGGPAVDRKRQTHGGDGGAANGGYGVVVDGGARVSGSGVENEVVSRRGPRWHSGRCGGARVSGDSVEEQATSGRGLRWCSGRRGGAQVSGGGVEEGGSGDGGVASGRDGVAADGGTRVSGGSIEEEAASGRGLRWHSGRQGGAWVTGGSVEGGGSGIKFW
nr:keratin, type I cytoskeletal 9-like [Setaria viridis]